MDAASPQALTACYLDGLATTEEVAALDRMLREAPEAAEAFAAAARLDNGLAEHFCQQARGRRMEKVLDQDTFRRLVRQRTTRRRLRLAGLAAAACALLVVGAAVWYAFSAPDDGARVLSGKVLVNGTQADRIPAGARIEVLGAEAAVLLLSDGTKATIEPKSRAILHGRQGRLRQLVELTEGAGAFRVEKGKGGFEVRTALGCVRVLGTEFTVKLIPDQPEKGTAMKTTYAMLAVAVLSGVVEVQVGDQTYSLGAGQNRLFAKEREGPKLKKVSGELTRVEGGSLTITRRGDRGESSQTVTVDSATKVLIETDQMETVPGEHGKTKQRPKLQDGTLADLKVGQKVEATCDTADKAVTVLVKRPPAPRSGGEREKNAAAPVNPAPRVRESERERSSTPAPSTPRVSGDKAGSVRPASPPRVRESERARTSTPAASPKPSKEKE